MMLLIKEKFAKGENGKPPATQIIKRLQRVINSCVNPEQSQVAVNYFYLAWEKYEWTEHTKLIGSLDFNHPLFFYHLKISLNHHMNEDEIRSSLNEL